MIPNFRIGDKAIIQCRDDDWDGCVCVIESDLLFEEVETLVGGVYVRITAFHYEVSVNGSITFDDDPDSVRFYFPEELLPMHKPPEIVQSLFEVSV